MADFWEPIKGKIKDLAGGWPSYVTLGSFVLYLLGYLSIRFHLTTLGIGTDLAVLDERYIFTGAKFVVYLFSSLPIVVMVALFLALIIVPFKIRRNRQKGKQKESKIGLWLSNPTRIALIGITVSVILIQVVMRKCFFFSNLLVAKYLPSAGLGLEQLLLDEDDGRRSLFFVGLLAGTIVTGYLFFYARRQTEQSSTSRFLTGLLALLISVQLLFLPVNYGVFIMDKSIPRVVDLGDQTPLKPGQEAWLVWEGTHGVTYLVRETTPSGSGPPAPAPRSLVTLPQKDLKRTEIIQYDQIIRLIFAP